MFETGVRHAVAREPAMEKDAIHNDRETTIGSLHPRPSRDGQKRKNLGSMNRPLFTDENGLDQRPESYDISSMSIDKSPASYDISLMSYDKSPDSSVISPDSTDISSESIDISSISTDKFPESTDTNSLLSDKSHGVIDIVSLATG